MTTLNNLGVDTLWALVNLVNSIFMLSVVLIMHRCLKRRDEIVKELLKPEVIQRLIEIELLTKRWMNKPK